MPPGDWNAGERGIAALPGREQEFREGVAKAIAYAQALGTPSIHAMAGLVPANADLDACRATFVENLRYAAQQRSEEHTSELQSLMRISYAVFCLKKKTTLYN